MTGTTPRRLAALLVVAMGAAIGALAPDGAAAAPRTAPHPARAAADTARAAAPDVRFVQHMIGHHAQALRMAALVPTHARRADLRALAERIDISQRDELALMRRWLQARGIAAPADDAHQGHAMPGHDAADMAAMPGMLTPDEMARLDRASGPEFDRLFLEGMIRHHEGALTMVAELLATPGAAQDPEIFRLASDVDADQRAEIRRMRALLAAR
jgi:uncharacterized protein (DUF305 family)